MPTKLRSTRTNFLIGSGSLLALAACGGSLPGDLVGRSLQTNGVGIPGGGGKLVSLTDFHLSTTMSPTAVSMRGSTPTMSIPTFLTVAPDSSKASRLDFMPTNGAVVVYDAAVPQTSVVIGGITVNVVIGVGASFLYQGTLIKLAVQSSTYTVTVGSNPTQTFSMPSGYRSTMSTSRKVQDVRMGPLGDGLAAFIAVTALIGFIGAGVFLAPEIATGLTIGSIIGGFLVWWQTMPDNDPDNWDDWDGEGFGDW